MVETIRRRATHPWMIQGVGGH